MASMLSKYGIKEVADLTFYRIDEDGSATVPVLYIDTAKVSTTEITAEQSDARGGKGNPKLITWDYGKEITVTIEDALFSAKSMAMMFEGDESAAALATDYSVERCVNFVTNDTSLPSYVTYDSNSRRFYVDADATAGYSITWYDENGEKVTSSSTIMSNKNYIGHYNVAVQGFKIDITADTFPGTYKVVGDTYARSEATGKDDFFQLIINKAKVKADNTLTLEAEGDPSTFKMDLTVLRPSDGSPMMELIQYTVEAEG